MNKQPKLTVEQLIIAIEMLSPAEKRKIQRHLPDLFDMPNYANLPLAEQKRDEQLGKHPYSFVESRNLLREIQENLSDEIVAQRGNRF